MGEIIEAANVTDVTERRIEDLGSQIVTLTKQAQKVALVYICEIGERLSEAKELVGHGNWTSWLRDRCDYSQGTAENYIKIYKEFGGRQLDFFENKNEEIKNLSYTKLLALTALNEEERTKLLNENDVEKMSVRELQTAIDNEKSLREDCETEIVRLKEKLDKQKSAVKTKAAVIDSLKEQLAEAEKQQILFANEGEKIKEQVRSEYQEKITAATAALEKSEAAQKILEDRLKRLEAEEAEKIAAAKAEGEKNANEIAEQLAADKSAEIAAELEAVKTKLAAAQKGTVHKAQYALDEVMRGITVLGGLVKLIEKDAPEKANALRVTIVKQITSAAEREL